MQFSDTVSLNVAPDRVWETLVDPYAIGSCLPGLQEVEVFDEGRSFGGEARIELGAASVSFPAKVTWVEQNAPQGGRLRATATLMGHEILGDGTVTLQADGAGKSTMAWQVDVTVPPVLAGNAIMMQMARTFATRFIQAFFACVQAHLSSV